MVSRGASPLIVLLAEVAAMLIVLPVSPASALSSGLPNINPPLSNPWSVRNKHNAYSSACSDRMAIVASIACMPKILHYYLDAITMVPHTSPHVKERTVSMSYPVLLLVSTKTTTNEVWDNLKMRFVGIDRVKVARLATLKGEFNMLSMAKGQELDDNASNISDMAMR
ncbi:hypothetical protein GUJ93_ZPchr0006g42185 [Zizania palustris]|uniref:Uncharacterized protein n=1 Tax=Zizania palustris TaxID=103762 RepID=A0A8J5W4N3_ZIZPA|nr:hypothetical protein GUJ93_ZPchr0006g42185 [Zizania palustris]